MSSTEKLQTEFDKAAATFSEKSPDSAKVFRNHAFLNKYLPAKGENALDIGCGLGDYVRYLARRSNHVLGLDLSPEMIRIARERSAGLSNVEFQVADVMKYDFPADHFDCVASFMTLHHMPLDAILGKIKSTMKPGGVLIVFDACEQTGLVNQLYALSYKLIGVAKGIWWKIKGKSRRTSGGRGVWQHDPDEVYPMFADAKRICRELLPGVDVRELYGLSRYAIVWKKP
jgi:ubiquinone/menaquinone biosynthesis C-methylase UbiE